MKLRVHLTTDDAADGVIASLDNCLRVLDGIKEYHFNGPEGIMDAHIEIDPVQDMGADTEIGIEAALDACIEILDGVDSWDYS